MTNWDAAARDALWLLQEKGYTVAEVVEAYESLMEPECTCYEIIGGHQQGCAFYGEPPQEQQRCGRCCGSGMVPGKAEYDETGHAVAGTLKKCPDCREKEQADETTLD